MNNIVAKFVSVIIPVYNDRERLKLCLTALENQTYPQELYEVIVVDNASEESIAEIVACFDRVVLTTETRRGSYAARNQGIKIAKGELIAFTDSDCIPAADWLEKGVKRLLSSTDYAVFAGRIDIFFKNTNRPTAAEVFDKICHLKQQDYVEKHHYGATANLFTFKQIFKEVGLFNARLKSGGDANWGQRVFAYGYPIIYADEVRISHPARNSVAQLVKKAIRTTGGTFDWNDRRPLKLKIKPPVRSAIRKTLGDRNLKSIWGKIKLTFIIIYIHYIRLGETIRLQMGGESRF
ncbi:glycosyltransferase family 2 protein [Myxosarcina sp. GI1]|uniref:glycosyltransferase n=1 Tax=Myxosarcina sp. GI1 TaxID=1541065 RepID=UPI0005661FA0|nr:glycosyltransferase family A protein [Myxosarcina sp. GI1]